MKNSITIPDIMKARSRALRYAGKLENCTFEGYLYIFARVINALRRVGIQFHLVSFTEMKRYQQGYILTFSYWKRAEGCSIVSQAEMYANKRPSVHTDELSAAIKKVTGDLIEWITPKNETRLF